MEDIRQAFRFSDEDVRNVRSLKEPATRIIPQVVIFFYEELLKLDHARAVFTGGETQMKHQAKLLAQWLHDLFHEDYTDDYFLKRRRVGQAHANIGLPQHLMCSSMELIWESLETGLRNNPPPNVEAKLPSLHRLLMLELAIMLESYKLSYSDQVRLVERNMVEEKLTRAEHLAEIGQLAASLAHEIKNPLAGISGAIQIIRDSMDATNPHRPIITEMLGQIHRLDATVKDLLHYARPTPPKAKKVDLDRVVRRVLMVLREEPVIQQVKIMYKGITTEAIVYADEDQLEQLLMNLILNAAQAVEGGGIVRIGVTPGDGAVELVIADDGQGMPASTRDRAFEPFYTTKARGTGLGLSICKRIVEVHGGRIDLCSELNEGTTVTVLLPANRAARENSKPTLTSDKTS